METEEIAQAPVTPAIEDAGSGQATPTIYETFKEKYGIEVSDEGSIINQFGEVFERAKAVDELKAQLEAANGRQPEYPTQAAEELALFQKALIAEGVTAPAEVSRRTREFLEENSYVYSELAETNPALVIGRGIRAANKHLSNDEINHLIKKENAVMPEPVNEADYHGDPEGLAEARAEYNDKMYDLRIRAKALLPKLEESKKNLDFQPKGFKTKEQEAADLQAYQKGIADSATAFKQGFKGFKAGEELIEVPKERFDKLWAEFSKPEGLADRAYQRIMDPSNPAGFDELATLVMLREDFPNIIAETREKAYSEALQKHKNDLRQGGGGSVDFGGDGIGAEAFKQAMQAYRPA